MKKNLTPSLTPEYNPCITCGACCAFFRASFYWAETNASPDGTVPLELTEKLTPFRCVMKGTNKPKPRCTALLGKIGKSVRCAIYPLRSSICRDFKYSYENNIHNPNCDRARAAHGLPPLKPITLKPKTPDKTDPTKPPTVPNAA